MTQILLDSLICWNCGTLFPPTKKGLEALYSHMRRCLKKDGF